MSEEKEYVCILGGKPRKNNKCKPWECESCGWEKSERKRRKQYMAAHGINGLTLCEDGIRRLDISKIERGTCWNF